MDRQTLWIGNRIRNEFIRIASSLENESVVAYADSLECVQGVSQPHLICLAISRPGEFATQTMQQIERLQKRFPTARVRVLLGEQCCGMKRTHEQLSNCDAVYVHEVPTPGASGWLTESVTELADSSPFGLPSPKPNCPVTVSPSSSSPLVIVYSKSRDNRQAIAEAMELVGVRTVELSTEQNVPVSGADFVIWEVEDGCDSLPDAGWISKRHPTAKIVALMSYPREYELAHLTSQGIRVVSQPFRLSNLFSIFGSSRQLPATSAA